MRAYYFTNMYLSPIQKGIQTAHCTAEFFMQTKSNAPEYSPLIEWADKYKTMIVLDGGNNKELIDLYVGLRVIQQSYPLPLAIFKEDEQSLNNATTCVGIIVNDKVYNAVSSVRDKILDVRELHFLLQEERYLVNTLLKYNLAT